MVHAFSNYVSILNEQKLTPTFIASVVYMLMQLQSIMSMQIVVVLMVVHPVAVWMASADVLIVTGSDKACHI